MTVKNLYNLSQLIEIVGDDEGLLKMVTIFVESTPRILNEMNQNFRNNHFDLVAQNAHKMKASIDMMHIISLYDVIRKIDKTEKVLENQDQLSEIIELVNSTLNKVFVDLKKEFSL